MSDGCAGRSNLFTVNILQLIANHQETKTMLLKSYLRIYRERFKKFSLAKSYNLEITRLMRTFELEKRSKVAILGLIWSKFGLKKVLFSL